MSNDIIMELERELDAPISYRGSDVDILKRGLSSLVNGVRSVRKYFGIMPRIRRYNIENLDPRTAGAYSPEDKTITLNAHTLRHNAEFGAEAGVHESIHGIQEETGSISAYNTGLYNVLGPRGSMLARSMIEGIASFYTTKIRGNTRDGYGQYRAGATQMARDHGEKKLIDASYIKNYLVSMAYSFIRGMNNYRPSFSGASIA